MSNASYFSRARVDPPFRHEELARLRWEQRVAVVWAIALTILWGAYAAYVGWTQHRWVTGDPLYGLVIAAGLYSHAGARYGALAAMDSELSSASQ